MISLRIKFALLILFSFLMIPLSNAWKESTCTDPNAETCCGSPYYILCGPECCDYKTEKCVVFGCVPSDCNPQKIYGDSDKDNYGDKNKPEWECFTSNSFPPTRSNYVWDPILVYGYSYFDCDDSNPAIKPGATEVCNGIDDNCNNNTDETFLLLNQACDVGVGECKKTGNYVCGPDMLGVVCNAIQGWPSEESCDGKDNDCDGQYDEGVQNACINYTTCLNYLTCNECPSTPKELCDGKDNNCNSQTDEEFPLLNQVCYVGVGECKKVGSYVCNENKAGVVCSAVRGTPTQELCDDKDNDCDGEYDEGVQNSCINYETCQTYATCLACQDIPTEICDGKDNNCNSQTDEGCSCINGNMQTCGYNNIGECKEGIQTCVNGQWDVCVGEVIPQSEICDGKDNNCNGQIDENLENCCVQIGETVEGCTDDINCPGIVGKRTCVNYEWGKCKSECPISINQSAIQGVKELDSIMVLPEIRKDETICEGKLVKTLDLSNFSMSCLYKTDKMTDYQDAPVQLKVYFSIGNNELEIKCGNVQQKIVYNLRKEENCTVYSKEISDFNQIINDFLDEGIITKDEVSVAEETSRLVSEMTSLSNKGDSSLITHTLMVNQTLTEMEFRVFIPKECANDSSNIDFYLGNYTYEIIREDPLIAWHFTDVKDRIDLSYKLKGDISQTCLDKIKGLPLAKIIENKTTKKTNGNFWFPFFLVALLITATLFLQKRLSEFEGRDKSIEQELMNKEREKLLRNIKDKKFKNKDEAINYLSQIGMNQETKDWIKKRL